MLKKIFCLTLILATLSACSKNANSEVASAQNSQQNQSQIQKQNSNQSQFFAPLEQSGAFLLSKKEALELARKADSTLQGLKSWQDMDFALEQSMDFAGRRAASSIAFSRPGLTVTWGDLQASLAHMRTLLPRLDNNPDLLASEFQWYRLGPDFGFTGYYEPTLMASRSKTARFNYPLYRLPHDIRKGKPYYSRAEIDRKGVLSGKGLEIAWTDSEIDAFFLHVQGSGRLLFTDNTVSHVLYNGKNNRHYAAIGRIMREQGLLPENGSNMNAIKKWIKENPSRQSEILDQNPSYVFFKEATRGPIGGMGKPLTPWVSAAVHPRNLPYGSMFFSTIPLPSSADPEINEPFNGILLAQDAGGAIKGSRIDLFCGPGDRAAHVAGYLDSRGAVYLLLPLNKK